MSPKGFQVAILSLFIRGIEKVLTSGRRNVAEIRRKKKKEMTAGLGPGADIVLMT
jgi:hypothetical protein